MVRRQSSDFEFDMMIRFSRLGRMQSFISLLAGCSRTIFCVKTSHTSAHDISAGLPFLPSNPADLDSLILDMNLRTCAGHRVVLVYSR